jgi:hypothetical protein
VSHEVRDLVEALPATLATPAGKVRLSGTRRHVLSVLAGHADDSGVCWPSMALVAREVGCSLSTARGHVADLERAGLLVRRAAWRKHGWGRTSNRYVLDLARIAAIVHAAKFPPPGGSAAENLADHSTENLAVHTAENLADKNRQWEPSVGTEEQPPHAACSVVTERVSGDGSASLPLRANEGQEGQRQDHRNDEPAGGQRDVPPDWRDEVRPALAATFGPPQSRRDRARVGRFLREVTPEDPAAPRPTAADVHHRAEVYRERFPGTDLTLEALAKHWTALGRPNLRSAS